MSSKCFNKTKGNFKNKVFFLKKINRLFNRNEKWNFLGIITAILFMALFQALGVALIFPFIKIVINPEIITSNAKVAWFYEYFGFQSRESFTIAIGVGVFLIIVIGNLFSALVIWVKTHFVYQKGHELSTALLDEYLSRPYAYFLSKNTADLSKNVVSEVRGLTNSFLMPLLEVISDLVVSMFILAALFLISPVATFSVLAIFFLFFVIMTQFKLQQEVRHRGKLRLKENLGCFKAVSESLGGIKSIKVLGREDFFSANFEGHSQKLADLMVWRSILERIPRYFIEIMCFGGTIAFIISLVYTGKNIQQIIPMVSLFVYAGYRLMPSLNKMFATFTILQFNQAVLDQIYFDLIEDKSSRAEKTAGEVEPLSFKENITLKNLSFSYPNTKTCVLKEINLTIPKNRSVAFVGPTGCGKTTLVDIILGLLTPTGGSIEVDGRRFVKDDLLGWQKILGYVPQDIYLSDDTLRRNIAFGIPDRLIDQEKIEKAAAVANLSHFINQELPQGYDTLVGERGVRLSGGQKQRLGIARALYNDPDIFIFDEATSALDGVTERSVHEAIDNISEEKTRIIIAHRLNTVRNCDIIYLLDEGKIIAQGNYQELIENNEQFRIMAGGDH